MKTLCCVAVVLLVGIVAWVSTEVGFSFRRIPRSQRPSATITVDKDKIHADEQKTKDNIQGFGQEAKEKVGDRAGKVTRTGTPTLRLTLRFFRC